jgi:NADP-dependent 3-hydroxy acid dehydrogenase YdfG
MTGSEGGILSGKVALITGASSGMGKATAKMLAQDGASVVVMGRRANVLQDFVEHKRAYRNPTTKRTSQWQMNERQLSERGFDSRSDD